MFKLSDKLCHITGIMKISWKI